MIRSKLFFLLAFIAVSFSILLFESCNEFISAIPKKSNPIQLTTFKLKFLNLETKTISEFTYRNINQFGLQKSFQADTIVLQHGEEYVASLEFIDESNPLSIINYTSAIKKDAKNYMVCMDATIIGIVIRTDSDGQFPLGLETRWLNGASTKGNFSLNLKHQPNMKNGNCELGTSLINLELPIIVK